MTKGSISKIGWGGFFALLLCMLMLSRPYSEWALHFWSIWSTAGIACYLSIPSPRSVGELIKSAALACLVLAGLAMLFYGEAIIANDGEILEDGFKTTFDSKAGAGAIAFIQLFIGSTVGIFVAKDIYKPE